MVELARIRFSALAQVAVALLAGTAPAGAQEQFHAPRKEQLPQSWWSWIGPVVDVDGDGDVDVVGTYDTLENDGAGVFTVGSRVPHRATVVVDVAAGDVDGDGDADLVVGTGGWSYNPGLVAEQNELLLNDGAGNFVDATSRLPQSLDISWATALGDVDGDGDLDVYFARFNAPDALYSNDGIGGFVDVSSRLPVHTTGQPSDAVFGDVDGDGDLDLVVAEDLPSQNRLYRNDGTGRFTDATASLPQVLDTSQGVALADVDADGDLDLVVANSGQNRLCRNDGTGTFIEATSSLPLDNAWSNAVAVRDVDGDGDADLMFSGNATLLYANDGTGGFSDVTASQMPPQARETWIVGLTDVDGDGDADAFLGDRLHLNSGTGTFQSTAGAPATDSDSNAIAFGDVDGDGDQDYVAARHRARNGVVLNDGQGVFRSAPANMSGPALSDSHDAALGDLDGDGDLDAVFIGNFHDTYLHLNDGAGTFTDVSATHMPPGYDYNACLELGDVDGDGDLDVVIGCSVARDRLYLNDGSARFTNVTTTHMPPSTGSSDDFTLGDIDGDGDLDMVFASFYRRTLTRFYLNDGSGRFRHATAGMPQFTTTGVDLGDVDGDGDLDLAAVDFGLVRLFLNDGRGGFTDVTAGMPPVPYAGYKVKFFDLDEDGDLDLVTAHIGQDIILINDGTGGFTDETARRPSRGSRYIAAADVDGDGDLDLMSAAPVLLTYNLRRQIQAPLVAVAGRGFELRVYARHSTATADIAMPFVAARRASIRLPPIGTLGLDPGTMIPIPAAPVPQPAGVASFVLPVPNHPALYGVTVHAQAVVVPTPGSPRLTNVITETVLR